jgi:hypothetical protein
MLLRLDQRVKVSILMAWDMARRRQSEFEG